MGDYHTGMAHFPTNEDVKCFSCINFKQASAPENGRCLKWGEFTGKGFAEQQGLDGWWRKWPTIRRWYRACKYHSPAQLEVFVACESCVMAKSGSKNGDHERWIRRIAGSFLIKTYVAGEEKIFSLQDGTPVPNATAEYLIANGWLKPQKDGLFDDTQTYRIGPPAELGVAHDPAHR